MTKKKIEIAKEAALNKTASIKKEGQILFGADDLLKHFIRKNFWLPRIEKLEHDVAILSKGIKYFTLCSKKAFDVRYFYKKGIINETLKTSFAFCEIVEEDFNFLKSYYVDKKKLNAEPFLGSLAKIATDTQNNNYGRFWGTFPFDVINLDYLGDILTTNHLGTIGENDFSTIDKIISQQFLLRRPYELWITMRAKADRYDHAIKKAFIDLIDNNIESNSEIFGAKFNELYSSKGNASSLADEDIFFMGFIKWLLFICTKSYSLISPNSEVIKYSRPGKDYTLYNILLRIKPYEHFIIPSPASEAAKYCSEQYLKDSLMCFKEPTDVNKLFEEISTEEKNELQEEVKEINAEFEEDNLGWL